MVQKERTKDTIVYACESCGFRYATKAFAEQCEQWCKEHKSCNLEITSQGVPPEELL